MRTKPNKTRQNERPMRKKINKNNSQRNMKNIQLLFGLKSKISGEYNLYCAVISISSSLDTQWLYSEKKFRRCIQPRRKCPLSLYLDNTTVVQWFVPSACVCNPCFICLLVSFFLSLFLFSLVQFIYIVTHFMRQRPPFEGTHNHLAEKRNSLAVYSIEFESIRTHLHGLSGTMTPDVFYCQTTHDGHIILQSIFSFWLQPASSSFADAIF